jgi:hypothetical protein
MVWGDIIVIAMMNGGVFNTGQARFIVFCRRVGCQKLVFREGVWEGLAGVEMAGAARAGSRGLMVKI